MRPLLFNSCSTVKYISRLKLDFKARLKVVVYL